MMGFQTAPAQLFYDFRLDDHVPTITCCAASTAFSTWRAWVPTSSTAPLAKVEHEVGNQLPLGIAQFVPSLRRSAS